MPNPERGTISPRGALWLASLSVWTLLGLADAADYLVSWRAQGHPAPVWRGLAVAMPGWLVWALLAPLVFWLARRVPIGWPPRVGSLAIHVPASLILGVLHATVHTIFVWWFRVREVRGNHLWDYIITILDWLPVSILIYGAVLVVAYGIDFYQRYRAEELRAAELARGLSEAQLEALTAQLHPHFLFNTLNAAVALVRTQDGPGAVRVLTQLGEILRTLLRTPSAQEIPLQEELAFVERYLEIERFRFSHRLQISTVVSPSVLACEVPSLILQPLVENAIRHGLASHDGAVSVAIEASASDGKLTLSVLDDGPGLPPGWSPGTSLGVGLGNTRARLEHLYGADGQLEIVNRSPRGVTARITLPLRRKAGGPPPQGESRPIPAEVHHPNHADRYQ